MPRFLSGSSKSQVVSRFRVLLVLAGCGGHSIAGEIPVPNSSFENPASPFVSLNIDHWQKGPKPIDYVEEGGFLWTQLVGIFKNTAPGQPDHIVNCEGSQAMWIFAVPGVHVFQDYDSMDWNDLTPRHEFNVRFEPGKSYVLTAGVIGGGGGMLPGATLDISLYWRDETGVQRPVAGTTITHSTAAFPSLNRFEEVTVQVPTVAATDQWAGRNLGILFRSTVSPALQGGYWDVDRVRLQSLGPLLLSGLSIENGSVRLTVSGNPATTVQLLSSRSVEVPISDWTPLATWTNFSGSMVYSAPASGDEFQRFYAARQLP